MMKTGFVVAVAISVVLGSVSVSGAQSVAASGSAAAAATASSASGCEALAALALPQARISKAQSVAAGALTIPNAGRGAALFAQLPSLCRVAAVLTPSPDSNIQMEIWLPAENWNGKFLAVGNGGWAGTISFDAMAAGLRRGYATASNDTGHTADVGARFALNNDKLIDFAYRAMHEMTVQSKSIVGAYYSRPPRLSYYQGCSTGGRQGMMEAQRYPEDFDAIIAGAPVYNMVHLNVSQTALQVHMLKNPDRSIPQNKVSLVANAAVAACDGSDGIKDNIINDPRSCRFDPGVLACKGGDAEDCLTPGQVETARQFYAPVKTKSGSVVYPGRSPGVEEGYAARIPVPGKPMNPLWSDMPRYVGHRDANWDVMSFDLDTDLALALKNASFVEASNPDLSKFKARGGKLLLWHGWADPGPAPENTITYYAQASKTVGESPDDWMRLFLLPGVAHCGGGVGPDQADFLGAMERWREQGVAPGQITASRNSGRRGLTPMSRPLCPFPQVAKYKGTGSTDEAGNFSCSAP
jgi:feruloyl esterase